MSENNIMEQDGVIGISVPRLSRGESAIEVREKFGMPYIPPDEPPVAIKQNECYKCDGGTEIKNITAKL